MTKQELEKKLKEAKRLEFFHAMKDRWDANDFEYDRKIHREIVELKKQLAECAE